MMYYGKLDMVRTDPGCTLRCLGFRRGFAATCVQFDIDFGRLELWAKPWIRIKRAAFRVARRAPQDVTVQPKFDECTTAHTTLIYIGIVSTLRGVAVVWTNTVRHVAM